MVCEFQAESGTGGRWALWNLTVVLFSSIIYHSRLIVLVALLHAHKALALLQPPFESSLTLVCLSSSDWVFEC